MLFSAVRDSIEYGLGSDCELKRRMTTRNGNSLTAKLANDIHFILLVLKGERLTYIKDMINIPKTRASRNRVMLLELVYDSEKKFVKIVVKSDFVKTFLNRTSNNEVMGRTRLC